MNFVILYWFIYILCINAKVISKEEVLKLSYDFDITYYCVNDTCVEKAPYVEFPNKNGTMVKYITFTVTYEDAMQELFCSKDSCPNNICTTDSECLSNKCVNNFCVFNKENPIVQCDSIHVYRQTPEMHCGKSYREPCESNEECSTRLCKTRCHKTSIYEDSPSDSDGVVRNIMVSLTIKFIIIIMIFSCLCYCKHKENKDSLE